MEKILPQEAIKVAIKKLINRVFGVESPKKNFHQNNAFD